MNAKTKTFASTAVFALILSLSVLGYSSNGWSQTTPWTRNEIAQFQDFMSKHPSVATDLRNNPQLVYDRKYLDKHDDVKDYLKKHPDVKQAIAENPRLVFGRNYNGRTYSGNQWDRRDDWRYDRWNDRDYRDYHGYR